MKLIRKDNDSLLPWIHTVPSEWTITRIDSVADVHFSNVDKHSHDDEKEVLLCNYVDVYKNDDITAVIDFMQATAEQREIEKFQLKKGDVLVTKDSEEPDDIAIPALVTEDLPGVICGYHLAMIRTRSKRITGEFLAWLHRSKQFRAQYEAKAVGVTRFGLSQYAFRSALIPLPPIAEQIRICEFLRVTCAAIDAVAYVDTRKNGLSAKEGILNRQMKALAAYRNSLITECVTGQRRITDQDFERVGRYAETAAA